jgi:hypothetical protein
LRELETRMTADLVVPLTEAIAALQRAIGSEDTRKLLMFLAKGLGAPERPKEGDEEDGPP